MILGEIEHNRFKYKQLYFLDKNIEITDKNWDILRVYQSEVELKNTNDFYTLFTKLDLDIDKIKQQFSKTIKQEINRNIKKDKILIEIIENPTLNQINELMNHYIEFKKFKNLTTDVEYMKKSFIAISKNIVIFKAKYENDYLIYHSYIVDNKRAKLKTSSSSRDNKEKELINLISRTNKRMHYEAIKYFKLKGKLIYDWGGVDKDISTGVSKFKKSFGGYLVNEYEGLIFKNKFIKLKYLIKEIGYIELFKKIIEKVKNV